MLKQARTVKYGVLGGGLAAVIVVAVLAGGSGASAASSTGEQERFTNYQAPTGPELTAQAAQERAISYARVAAGANGALTVVSVHSTFAKAHTLLMGEAADQAASQEVGSAERVEEMRSTVWVTKITTDDGTSLSPNLPVPPNAKGPSGQVLILVEDAHTGFTKERYLGPASTSPDLSSLGQTSTAEVPAASTSAVSSRRRNPREGSIGGRLSPIRIHVLVTLRNASGHKVAAERTASRSAETAPGSFLFRELAGRYSVSAPGCATQHVYLKGRQQLSITLHCSRR